MFEHPWMKKSLVLLSFLFLISLFLETDALARVGGGKSSGSRGSRSYSQPKSSSPSKSTQPSQQASPSPSPQPQPQAPTPPPVQAPAPQGSFMRSLGAGLLGGMIGGMLFRGLGFGSTGSGFGGGGIGLIEILLFAALLFGVYWYFKRRRQEATAQAYRQSYAEPIAAGQTSGGLAAGQFQGGDGDLDKGLGYIRQMDSSFDTKRFQDQCMDQFFKIQGAWTKRDMSGAKALLTDEMFGVIQGDAGKLRAEKKVNRLENIAVRSVDVVEAWQESGSDFITVRFYANLLDYVEDEKTGEVLSGSKTEPVKFEEYWTFTRPVGNSSWKLSAIQQVE